MSIQMELPLKPIAKHGNKIRAKGLSYQDRIIAENKNFDKWLEVKGAWFK